MFTAPVVLTALGGTAWFVAQQTDAPWPTWIGLPANLGAVALLLWLVLTGRQLRREDVDALVAAERKRADERVADCETRSAERLREAAARERMITDRLDAVVADRNAWREAHHQETLARATAEQATSRLLVGSDVTVRLLETLERAVGGHPPTGTG